MNRPDELSAALRRLPAPEPTDLLPRIMRSRALGVRVADPARRLVLPWGWLAAAAVVGVLISGSWFGSVYLSRLGNSSAVRRPIDEFLRGTGVLPKRREGLPDVAPPPKYELITSGDLDVTRLKDGVWTYVVEKTTDDVLTERQGGISIRLVRGSYLGSPVWLVSSARQLRAGPWGDYADTTYLDPATLRPERAIAYGDKFRMRWRQSFAGDSGHEAIDRTGRMARIWRGSVALPFSRDVLFINDWSTMRLAVLAAALPLARGWHGSLYQVQFIAISNGKRPTSAPIDLRVRGTDRVTVPAGDFDCWRVEVDSHLWNEQRETFWISRDNGWLIKTEMRYYELVETTRLASYQPGS